MKKAGGWKEDWLRLSGWQERQEGGQGGGKEMEDVSELVEAQTHDEPQTTKIS